MDKLLFIMLFAFISNVQAQIPDDYTSVYSKDFETTTTKAGEYLKNDAWYFYWSGDKKDVTNWDHPELHKRFIIITDPKNSSNKCIEIIKFNDDKDYTGRIPPLNPRSELSFRPSCARSTAKEMYFHIKTYFPASQLNVFSGEFIQFWLHGGTEEIPLQIEVRDGFLAARNPRTNGYRYPFTGKELSKYLDQWITWEVRARFTNSNGYWRIYMNGELVFTHTASIATWPTSSGTWHPQFGAYANNGGAGTMVVYFDDFIVAEYSQPTSIDNIVEQNEGCIKIQNYPNPFLEETSLTYCVEKEEIVRIAVYNVKGQMIKLLLNEQQQIGQHTVVFDGNDLPSGVYYCQINVSNKIENCKMILIK